MLACWQAAFLSPYPLEIALYNPIGSAYCPVAVHTCLCSHIDMIYIYMLYSVFYILCILFVFTSINPPVCAETQTDVSPRHLWALLTSTQMAPCTATHHHSFLKGQMLPFYKWPTPSQNPTCTVCRQLFQVVRAWKQCIQSHSLPERPFPSCPSFLHLQRGSWSPEVADAFCFISSPVRAFSTGLLLVQRLL